MEHINPYILDNIFDFTFQIHRYIWTLLKKKKTCSSKVCEHLFGLQGVGSPSSRIHRVVKYLVIPANGCESVGATVEPTHTFDKILVSPISKSAEKYMIFIFKWYKRLTRCYSMKSKVLHFSQFRVQNSEGAIIAYGSQHGGGTRMEKKKRS